jgi:hypothetical protein
MPTLWTRRASAPMTSREVGDSRSSSALNTTLTFVSAQARARAS